MNEANGAQGKIDKTIKNLQAYRRMQPEVKKQILDKLQGTDLKNDITTLEKMLEDSKKQLENAIATVSGPNSTTEQKKREVDAVKTSTNKNNEKITELKNKIETAAEVIKNVEAEKTTRENKLEEIRRVVAEAYAYHNKLYTANTDCLVKLCEGHIECVKSVSSPELSEDKRKNLINKLEAVKDRAKECDTNWINDRKEANRAYYESKEYDCRKTSNEEIDKKIEELKKLITIFDNLFEKYRPIYDKLVKDIRSICEGNEDFV